MRCYFLTVADLPAVFDVPLAYGGLQSTGEPGQKERK